MPVGSSVGFRSCQFVAKYPMSLCASRCLARDPQAESARLMQVRQGIKLAPIRQSSRAGRRPPAAAASGADCVPAAGIAAPGGPDAHVLLLLLILLSLLLLVEVVLLLLIMIVASSLLLVLHAGAPVTATAAAAKALPLPKQGLSLLEVSWRCSLLITADQMVTKVLHDAVQVKVCTPAPRTLTHTQDRHFLSPPHNGKRCLFLYLVEVPNQGIIPLFSATESDRCNEY